MRPLALHLEMEAYSPGVLDLLEAHMELREARPRAADELKVALADASFDTLIITLGLFISDDVMESCPTLRWIVTPTTGLDHIDLEAAQRRNINVVSLGDAKTKITNVTATAELTWGLLLAVARRIPLAHYAVSSGQWDRRRFLGVELANKTLGIVGAGRLGRMVAQYGLAFNMDVIAHDIDPSALAELPPAVTAVSADELVEHSHVVTMHLSLSGATTNWLDASRIARLTSGAIVINTARGELVDEAALAAALECGRIGGVGVDVLANEREWGGRTAENPLLAALQAGCNIVTTPHIGGYAVDAIAQTREVIVRRFLKLRFGWY